MGREYPSQPALMWTQQDNLCEDAHSTAALLMLSFIILVINIDNQNVHKTSEFVHQSPAHKNEIFKLHVLRGDVKHRSSHK